MFDGPRARQGPPMRFAVEMAKLGYPFAHAETAPGPETPKRTASTSPSWSDEGQRSYVERIEDSRQLEDPRLRDPAVNSISAKATPTTRRLIDRAEAGG